MNIDITSLTGEDLSIGSSFNVDVNGFDIPVVVVESSDCTGCAFLGICHLGELRCMGLERPDGKDVIYARTDVIKSTMKVFINRRVASYSGGLAMVAANTPEEANEILLKEFPDHVIMYDKDGYGTDEEEECVYKSHWAYKYDNWKELAGVTAEYAVPTFLVEDGYSE